MPDEFEDDSEEAINGKISELSPRVQAIRQKIIMRTRRINLKKKDLKAISNQIKNEIVAEFGTEVDAAEEELIISCLTGLSEAAEAHMQQGLKS
ncbi:hypothetical protein N7478_008609 [Penicillium angulare]|uniref:uncharacterized protein n=1 Tax=Penicillium angulare TaxID=116970 RepID=UPI0025412678|nr:uncharacterized protein N7478_008609 [Penicillium angulare]KAJ5273484.1 hypothetical protein N7478_008609 [Penicillium angulare]